MRTVVALRALGLGDLLTALPALRALARAFPCRRRILAAPRALAALAVHARAAESVHDTRPLAPLDPDLAEADLAVNLHGKGPQSRSLLEDSRPRRLISFGGDGPEWRPEEHEVARWCRLLEESGIPADPSDLDMAPPALRVPRVAIGATLIHPGAASGARRWPVERFAAIARAERADGRQVVVTGGTGDIGLAQFLGDLAGLPRGVLFAGRTDLVGLAALVAAAGRVVCGDTGVAHLATALRTPSVVVFGPVSPERWGPPADRPWHRALWAGRTGDPHADRPDPGLLEIQVADVVAALGRLEPSRAA
ncbi:MAG TPA: glycosyltransferase family 9 protein [Gaiellaceae bacterium]